MDLGGDHRAENRSRSRSPEKSAEREIPPPSPAFGGRVTCRGREMTEIAFLPRCFRESRGFYRSYLSRSRQSVAARRDLMTPLRARVINRGRRRGSFPWRAFYCRRLYDDVVHLSKAVRGFLRPAGRTSRFASRRVVANKAAFDLEGGGGYFMAPHVEIHKMHVSTRKI